MYCYKCRTGLRGQGISEEKCPVCGETKAMSTGDVICHDCSEKQNTCACCGESAVWTDPWVGFDLDGTLAHYDGWKGVSHIGEPVVEVVELARRLLDRGIKVKIMTARAVNGDYAISFVKEWCKINLGREVPVTNAKDLGMVLLIDDRVIQVKRNAGQLGNLDNCAEAFLRRESKLWKD